MSELEYAKYVSAIRRLNAKIVQANKTFGKGSASARKITGDIASLIPSDALYFNKNGIIQISRSKELFNKYGVDYLGKAENIQSTKHLLQHAEQTLLKFPKQFKMENAPRNEIIKRSNLLSRFDELSDTIIPMLYKRDDELSKKAIDILKQRGSRNTYDELEKIVNIYDGGNA